MLAGFSGALDRQFLAGLAETACNEWSSQRFLVAGVSTKWAIERKHFHNPFIGTCEEFIIWSKDSCLSAGETVGVGD